MRALDQAWFRAIHNWPDSLEPVMRFFSEAVKEPTLRLILLAFVVWMLFRGSRNRQTILLALVVAALSNEATDLLKAGFPMDRPSVELSHELVRGGGLTSPGTASAHSANMAGVATVFMLRSRWLGALWIPIAILTGVSRIYMGVHYPSQVLLGWTIGALCGIVAVKSWEAYVGRDPRGKEPQAVTDEPDTSA